MARCSATLLASVRALGGGLTRARPGATRVSTAAHRATAHFLASCYRNPKGVDLVVLDQGVDTSTALGRMPSQILGATAESERALTSERTRDGLAATPGPHRWPAAQAHLLPAQIAQDPYDELGPDGRLAHAVAEIAVEFEPPSPESRDRPDRLSMVVGGARHRSGRLTHCRPVPRSTHGRAPGADASRIHRPT